MYARRCMRAMRTGVSCGRRAWPVLIAFGAATMASTTAMGDHETDGKWKDPPGGSNWGATLLAEHGIHLKTGEILVYDHDGSGEDPGPQLWDPVLGGFTEVNIPYSHLIDCGGHTGLANGNVLMSGGGGEPGPPLKKTSLFNNSLLGWVWTAKADMKFKRWYNTLTTLRDGDVLVFGGSDPNGNMGVSVITPEIYDVDATPPAWNRINLGLADLTTPHIHRWYPRMFVAPDDSGKNLVFYAGGSGGAHGFQDGCGMHDEDCDSFMLDIGAKTWTRVDENPGGGGSAVIYELLEGGVEVLRCGGGDGSKDTKIITLTDTTPLWDLTIADMNHKRRRHQLVLLPDGTILAIGGSEGSNIVKQTELIDPNGATTWSVLASSQYNHERHTIALLMADGSVLVAGGDRLGDEEDQLQAEIFEPPYLWKNHGTKKTPPEIDDAPLGVCYQDEFEVKMPVGSTDTIDIVSFLRLGAVTHGFDQAQRFVPLDFSQLGITLTVTAPDNGSYAPPGYYMLFIVNDQGVPSTAAYVKLN